MVDSRDVGDVAASIAADPTPHAGHTYLLTGPELITYGDVANELAITLGRRSNIAKPPRRRTERS